MLVTDFTGRAARRKQQQPLLNLHVTKPTYLPAASARGNIPCLAGIYTARSRFAGTAA